MKTLRMATSSLENEITAAWNTSGTETEAQLTENEVRERRKIAEELLQKRRASFHKAAARMEEKRKEWAERDLHRAYAKVRRTK